jgi:purine-nucleoside phosphorylase
MNREKFFKFCYGCSPSDFSKTAIVTPFLPIDRFEGHGEIVKNFKGQLYSGSVILKNDERVTVIRCRMGDRLTGDAILLLKETAVQKIIFAGSCGGLRDSQIGDTILCESAFDGEGFSRYCAEDFTIDRVLNSGRFVSADSGYVEALRDFFSGREKENLPKAGDIFTIGSLVSEKKETLLKIEEKGFIGIDLELSAVYSAAQAIGRKAVGLLFVSDLPLKKPLGEELTSQEKTHLKEGIEKVICYSAEFAARKEKK